MAEGPCGDSFKDAFSCFVYSKADPRGSDCVEQFQQLQNCLLSHPEVYGKGDEETTAVGDAASAGGVGNVGETEQTGGPSNTSGASEVATEGPSATVAETTAASS